MLLWLIDDTMQHHDTAEATAARVPGVRFAGFVSGEEGVEAYRQVAGDVRLAPDVVLMDFFLGDDRGDRVTTRLRRIAGAKRPVIIGYSSVPSGSAAIVAAGADLVLRKQRDDEGINPALLAWLRAHRRATDGA